MPVFLLTVGERLSLEFETSDLEAVRLYINQRYGGMDSKAAGIAAIVTLAGEDFTFQNEWDDPCLIAHSIKGDALLRAIHADFRKC